MAPTTPARQKTTTSTHSVEPAVTKARGTPRKQTKPPKRTHLRVVIPKPQPEASAVTYEELVDGLNTLRDTAWMAMVLQQFFGGKATPEWLSDILDHRQLLDVSFTLLYMFSDTTPEVMYMALLTFTSADFVQFINTHERREILPFFDNIFKIVETLRSHQVDFQVLIHVMISVCATNCPAVSRCMDAIPQLPE